MFFWQIIKIALRGIIANKMRSFLTMLGIIIGVGAVIAMISIGEGAKKQVLDSISGLGTNLLRVMPGAARMGHVRSGSVETLTIDDADAIKAKLSQVRLVAPSVSAMAQAKFSNNNTSTYIRGTSPEFLKIRNFTMESGALFTHQDVKMMRKVAVLGATVKNDLFGEGTPLGKYIKINGVNFLIIGVTKRKGQTSWRDPDNQIFIPFSTFQKRLFRRNFLDDIYLQIEDVKGIEDAKKEIESLLRRKHRIPYGKESDFNIRDYTEFLTALKETSRTFTVLLGGTAVISLLVGGIGVMNIMLVSVTERTREIGIRMAVGAKKRDILRQFLIEAMVLTIVGGIAGIGLGVSLANIISSFGIWGTVITPQSILLAFTFSAVIGLIFGLYPARKASRLNPIDALRYE